MDSTGTKSSDLFDSFQGADKPHPLPELTLNKQKSAPAVKHINSSYGITFQSEVDLFHPKHMTNYQLNNPLNTIPPAQVIHLTFALLRNTIETPHKLALILKNFKEYDSEMQLKVARLVPMESSITMKPGCGSNGEVKLASGVDSKGQSKVHDTSIMGGSLTLSKKNSIMNKSNKVEMVEKIPGGQGRINRHLSAIKSAESIESKEDFLNTEQRIGDDLGMPPVLNKEADCSIEIKQMDGDSKSWFSDESAQMNLLQNMKPPTLPFNEQTIQRILSSRSPFLINLALCLFYKCVRRSGVELTRDNVGWLLSIATIVAYKIFYDQTLQGIMQWYADILGRSVEGVAGLQRWFLGSMDYQVVVSNRQYQQMLHHLVTASDE